MSCILFQMYKVKCVMISMHLMYLKPPFQQERYQVPQKFVQWKLLMK
ncbi:Uncharacterised protein [Klebsiella pneumoniae]|nr:Uncharacterised protein [Klebsiella pneumoniae]